MNLQADSDELLLQRIMVLDETALSILYDRYAQTVYNLVMRIVRDPGVADEVLQETFWQVWKKANEFRGEGAVAAWLCRIARNKGLDALRRRKTEPQPIPTINDADGEGSFVGVAADRENELEMLANHRWNQIQLQRALSRLPIEQRQCLEMAYFEGMSQNQIARHTQIPVGTIKTRMRMGLEKLGRILRADGLQAEDI